MFFAPVDRHEAFTNNRYRSIPAGHHPSSLKNSECLRTANNGRSSKCLQHTSTPPDPNYVRWVAPALQLQFSEIDLSVGNSVDLSPSTDEQLCVKSSLFFQKALSLMRQLSTELQCNEVSFKIYPLKCSALLER